MPNDGQFTGTEQNPANNATSANNPAANSSDEKQQNLDRIIANRLDRERQKFERQFEETRRELLQAADLRIKQSEDRANQLEGQLKSYALRDSVRRACERHNAIDPEIVIAAVKENLRIGDDGQVNVLLDGKQTNLTVDEHVGRFLQDRLYLVKASPCLGGGGSRASGGMATTSRPDLSTLEGRREAAKAFNESAGRK